MSDIYLCPRHAAVYNAEDAAHDRANHIAGRLVKLAKAVEELSTIEDIYTSQAEAAILARRLHTLALEIYVG